MNISIQQHQPVLLQEVLDNLVLDENGIYIDGTFGRGGHSTGILKKLSPKGFLLAIDQDPEAIESSKHLQHDTRFHIEKSSFSEIKSIAEKYNLNHQINGILLDLGVSSPQLNDPKRGFSFLHEGPLDMRMDPSRGVSASAWLATVKEQELVQVLKNFGEERFARRIASAIVNARQEHAITTTTELAEIIAKANPKWEKHKHPATRSFQAIRIFINNELEALRIALENMLTILKPGGRFAVISFHSLEDRIVKRFIRDGVRGPVFPKGLPIQEQHIGKKLKKVSNAIVPTAAEIATNPRARSAVLRIAEKI